MRTKKIQNTELNVEACLKMGKRKFCKTFGHKFREVEAVWKQIGGKESKPKEEKEG